MLPLIFVSNCNLSVCLNIIVGDDAYIVPLLCSRADVGIRPYKSKLYIVANNYPAVGTGVLDCPFMVNFTRTVWKPVPTIIIVNTTINYNLHLSLKQLSMFFIMRNFCDFIFIINKNHLGRIILNLLR